MDELLKLANSLMENDNYKNEDFGEFILPDGEYLVNIDKIELKTSELKGTQWINFTTTIVDGEHTNKKIFISMFLTEKTIKRTLTSIMNLINSFGYTLDSSMFTDYETLVEALQEFVNETASVTKHTSGNFTHYKIVGGLL